MATHLFVNLPVTDLDRTKEFFSNLGFTYNEQFTDDKAACMVVNETSMVMLLMKEYFQGFTGKETSDARAQAEVIMGYSVDSREAVDEAVAKAIAGGGRTTRDAVDYGFMYQHGFEDLDGHLWEVIYMDPNATMPE